MGCAVLSVEELPHCVLDDEGLEHELPEHPHPDEEDEDELQEDEELGGGGGLEVELDELEL
jgi:hypothetical protein